MLQNFDDLQGHDPEAEEAIASLDDVKDEPKKDEAKVDPPAPPVASPSEQPKPVDPPPAVQ